MSNSTKYKRTNIDALVSELKQSHQDGMSLKAKVGYSVLAAATAAGLIWLGNRWIKKEMENKAQSKSFEEGKPETIAKQIKMAFDNDGVWGTDMPKLRSALLSIKSKKQMKEVYDAYSREYHQNLYKDMSNELQSSEYNEVLQIIAAKPDKAGAVTTTSVQYTAWAKRLKAAFDKSYWFIPGTDENAIKAVFVEIPTQHDFIMVGMAYKKEYGDNLITVLKSELELWEYNSYMNIILSKRKA